VAGAKYPTEVESRPITPLEGRSLVPAFEGKPIQRDALYWEHEGNRAVRAGKWKLVARGPKNEWKLYDLDADRTELNNLAAQEPERVRQMAALWDAWAERCGVVMPGKFPKKK